MSRRLELVADSHHGHDNQVEMAVGNLNDRQRKAFDQAFHDYDAWQQDHYTTAVDPEFSSWVTDWIEQNTRMFWEDGMLWEQVS